MVVPFPKGKIVAISRAWEVLLESGEDPLSYLSRHASGDWGNVDAHDRKENELSLKHGWRIVSSYQIGEKTIWIITEADRSVTTILLPEDY